MTAVLEKCKKCGQQFLRGIFPQRTCEQCEMRVGKIVYTAKSNKIIWYDIR